MSWKRKLASRKLWMAIAGLIAAIMVWLGSDTGSVEKVGAIILALGSVTSYIFGQGIADQSDTVTHIYPGDVRNLPKGDN